MPADTFRLDKSEFIIFDLETTGLDRRIDRIIEIGAIKVKDGVVIDRFSMLLNPGKTQKGTQIYISNEITQLTGITNKEVENQPVEAQGVSSFIHWVGDTSLVVGHNINSFDLPFLLAACKRAKCVFPFTQSIDTLRFVRSLQLKKQGLIPNEKQETIGKYFGIEYNAHRALDDVEALTEIFRELCQLQTPVIHPLTKT